MKKRLLEKPKIRKIRRKMKKNNIPWDERGR
jgi:hypothetical protein